MNETIKCIISPTNITSLRIMKTDMRRLLKRRLLTLINQSEFHSRLTPPHYLASLVL